MEIHIVQTQMNPSLFGTRSNMADGDLDSARLLFSRRAANFSLLMFLRNLLHFNRSLGLL